MEEDWFSEGALLADPSVAGPCAYFIPLARFEEIMKTEKDRLKITSPKGSNQTLRL